MSDRRSLKSAHEDAVIQQFVDWLNIEKSTNYKITEKPDPPDALIVDGRKVTWVEQTDLYGSMDEARSEITYLSKVESHIPHDTDTPVMNPEINIASVLLDLMKDKLSKSSYIPYKKKYGKGYLVISERDPYFDRQTIEAIDLITENSLIPNDKRCFKGVFLAIRNQNGLAFGEIRYYTNTFSRLLWKLVRYITSRCMRIGAKSTAL